MSLTINWLDISGIQRLGNALGRLSSHEKRLGLQRAVNHTGDKARTQVIRALAKQTGLGYGVIRKAVRTGSAWGAGADGSTYREGRGSLSYILSSKGGDISLKFFKARETRAGVTAAPFGERRLFAGAFLKGGQFPNRVVANGLNGHVYERVGGKVIRQRGLNKGKRRQPLKFMDSGVVIPTEMLRGPSAEAFSSTVNAELPKRVMHEINRLAPGIFI
ncbi:hypothetical protein [Shinella sp.]|uniref:hypothetical protein n=1 Tax=Shinella sp. TaxID=1870904 RepID=UPI003F6EF18F